MLTVITPVPHSPIEISFTLIDGASSSSLIVMLPVLSDIVALLLTLLIITLNTSLHSYMSSSRMLIGSAIILLPDVMVQV